MKVRHKPVARNAVQWFRPAMPFLGPGFPKADEHGVTISGPRNYCPVYRGVRTSSELNDVMAIVNEGDWILTDEAGRRFVVPDEAFREWYEAAD
jgi:hypothetical protein